MLRDIFAIPVDEPRYKENVLEIHSELDSIIQQVDCLLFTGVGDVMGNPRFGCNLEQYLFETTWNESAITEMIRGQIRDYIVYDENVYHLDVSVSFVQWEQNVAMVVDLKINNKAVASYLV